jgi:pimeloyl-ACP methyl ester carboxylesterase
MNPDIDQRLVQLSEVRLNVATAGPEDGPLVVLLHGFPEFWYGWRSQIPALAGAGFRVVAPDQRGYHRSDKPRGLAPYRIDRLANDIGELIAAQGRSRAMVVGHDWGGAVAWWLAIRHPSVVERLAVLNMPHPAVMFHHLMTNPKQVRRSWYIFFFLLPGQAERAIESSDGVRLARVLAKTANPGSFSDEDLAVYRAAWREPDALRGMLAWYRAAAMEQPFRILDRRIAAPTLLLWGTQDQALGEEMAEPSIARCDRGRLITIEDATHWVHHDQPARVNQLLLEHLSER